MLATARSSVLSGADGQSIEVEVHVANGLPVLNIVGLPDAACKESRDRVRAAIVSSGFKWPQRRITVNLAPSQLRKTGSVLDLPIAVAILVADEQLPLDCLRDTALIGELGLDGLLREVPGIIPLCECIDSTLIVVPAKCERDARLMARGRVVSARCLAEVAACITGRRRWPQARQQEEVPHDPFLPDLSEVCGQTTPRWALEIAAAGGHHMLMIGPPGSGKTMLASRLPGLLPNLSRQESIEVTRIHSAAGIALPGGGLIKRPPFRSPHHTASMVAMAGGGSHRLRPGEMSAAHSGVLFLDELAEFSLDVVNTLRQPLEEGSIQVSRAYAAVRFPARFMLVAAMNPCPCGGGIPDGQCRCASITRTRYQAKISGPLLDRFDLRVHVDKPDADELLGRAPEGEPTAKVAERVAQARQLSLRRGWSCNAAIPGPLVQSVVKLSPGAEDKLEELLLKGKISARGFHRLRRVARTIADLSGRPGPVTSEDVRAANDMRVDPFEQGARP